jgi:hypothetical protein
MTGTSSIMKLYTTFPASAGNPSCMLSGRYMVQEPETAPLILLSLTDIPKRKKIEAALIQAEKLAIQLPQNHMQLRRSRR